MKIILGGALGRMGKQVTEAAGEAGIEIVCGVDVAYAGQPTEYPIVTSFDQVTAAADVLVDFSRPDGLSELLGLLKRAKLPAVLCTTGYTDVELAQIQEASSTVAIFRSANMSLGINVLCKLVAMAAKALGDDFDVEIVEKHHKMKVDSPSGTALMLYEAVRHERADAQEPVYGRYGRNAKRQPEEIGIHAVRGGTVTGEHEIGFYGNGEELILTHRAENRSLFAQGALRAARFLAGKPAGMYAMSDVVEAILS
ncbi:MAG: 4-hydroxy-tetrahydrodipicolinate reductase [Eubacteriales bacterium]|nr:4-hydroxy-tetrahydrodipicolinate reductase [Eubacteriales bacterium]